MKNNTFFKLVAVLLAAVLCAGLFSIASFADEKVISDDAYTDLSYDNGTVIIKIDAGRLSEIIQKREFNKEAFIELLPSGLYEIYKTRSKESVVNFLCALAEKEVLTHEEMLRLFNNKSEILDKYFPVEYWKAPGGGEATQAEVADNIRAAGGTKLKKDIRNFFVQFLLEEVDEMTCNGTTIFTGEPDWVFDHNEIQTVVLKSLPDVQESAQLKDGDALLDLAFSTTGQNVNVEFGFKVIITGDCSYINENAERFAKEVTYVVEDSGTVNATVTFDEVFAEFYADALNSDKFTEDRKFELLGIYTLSANDLIDFITNEEIDELVAFGSIVSEERAAQIESFRDLLTKILAEMARMAPKSDTVANFTTIAENYKGNGEFSYTIHEEFSFIAAVNTFLEKTVPGAAEKLPDEWVDLISKDDHIIDQTTTINIADFYRVRYYDADNNLLYLTFMPVGFDLTYLNAAAELQGHGADGWFDMDVPGGDAVTVMPDKDIDLRETPTICDHNYEGPVWSWADDYSSATATFTCSICSDELTETDSDISVSEDKINRKITYTAEILFKGTTYTDTKIVDMGPCDHTYGEPVWNWADDYSSATATFTCSECGDVQTLDATVTSEEDTENGKIIYTAKVTFNETEYTDTVSVDIPACEHTYGEPVWAWADDYSSATATFTCSKCGDVQTLDATVTSEEDTENGKIIYTAKVTFNETEYTDTVSVDIPPCEHTYGEPVWNWADDYSSATAIFTCTICGDEQEVTATITSEEDKENNVIIYTATVTFNGTVYTDTVSVTIVTPPPTGESVVWFTVAGTALAASAAAAVIIIRRKQRV